MMTNSWLLALFGALLDERKNLISLLPGAKRRMLDRELPCHTGGIGDEHEEDVSYAIRFPFAFIFK